MITITNIHPCKRPLLFSDIEVGDLFVSGDNLYVRIREIVEEDTVDNWINDENQMFNAVCISGKLLGDLATFEDSVEVALFKKEIAIKFDPDVDLQRWV